jgi:hypothetical protein
MISAPITVPASVKRPPLSSVPPEINLVVKAVVVFVVMLLQSSEFRRQLRALALRPAPGASR